MVNGSALRDVKGVHVMSEKIINDAMPAAKTGGLQHWIRQRRINKNWQFYMMLILPLAWYLIFCYVPMYGVTLAFKKFSVSKGILASPWVDPWNKWFMKYFNSPYFSRTLLNTFLLSFYSLIFGFPLPILLALLLNEVRSKMYQKFVQNITYIPHFLSIVVLVGLLNSFTNRDYGIVNKVIQMFGGEPNNWMQVKDLFRKLYVGSGVWQNMGWDSIIYIAALAGVDPQLHESAYIDGANRYQCMWHINLPGIMPTVVIMLILNSGHILSVGFEKVFLMQNEINIAVSDVIATYVYRISLLDSNQYELSTAIGLFNSLVNCTMLIVVNQISRKVSDVGLW